MLDNSMLDILLNMEFWWWYCAADLLPAKLFDIDGSKFFGKLPVSEHLQKCTT